LTEKERENMLKILNKDLSQINEAIMTQFEKIWLVTQHDIEDELGFGKQRREIAELEEQIQQLQNKVNELQRSMKEYSETPGLEDYQEAGLGIPDNRNGSIYNHDVEFMGHRIGTKMDLRVAKRLKETIDPMKPVRMLQEVAESSIRAVVMSGTFEEAREAYKTFYSLDWRRFGVEIPRLLGEIKAVVGPNLLGAGLQIQPMALPGPEPKKEDKSKKAKQPENSETQ